MATFNLNIKIHVLLYFLISSPLANPLQFSYTGYTDRNLIIMPKPNSGDSSIEMPSGIIDLTKNTATDSLKSSCGWVSYKDPIPLMNPNTGQQAMFATRFSFKITANVRGSANVGGSNSETGSGDGFAFYVSPFPHDPDLNKSCGGNLGLFNNDYNTYFSKNQLVAVEFDTYLNKWDFDDHHVGININTINSTINQTLDDGVMMKNGTLAYAWITYDTQNLSVYLSYSNDATIPNLPILSYPINLTDILPDEVAIGFSAATGTAVETHQILSWDFNSTDIEENISPQPHYGDNGLSPYLSPPYYGSLNDQEPEKGKSRFVLSVVFFCVIGVAVFVVALVWFLVWMKRKPEEKEEEISESDQSSEDFDPKLSKSYTYKSLVIATSKFLEENKLGEGGFGPVYKGVLRDPQREVAVKRVSNSKRSKEGFEEYKSEVKVLSRLSHRNLVELEGWCEEKNELLLVYKFMPNGSLSSQLYSKNRLLTWPERYKIALGLASALNYLHEECELCILHRDIKPGNVLLDSELNAKLSDFGLSRLVDHNHTSKNTLLAGTQGYLAPEYFHEGRASKESDVYSFGIVLLEIACGRPPLGQKDGEINLVESVLDHYGRREILQVVDKRLNDEFDEQEMEHVLIVGLWCVHPSYIERPKISQAFSALKLSVPLPDLPSSRPSLFFPPMDQYLLFQKLFASNSTGEHSVSSGNVTRSSHVSSSTFGSLSIA